MKNMRIELRSNPDDDKRFFATASGNEDDIAQMIFAYLTYKPDLLYKVFKKILDEVYGGNYHE